jgi:hypothetical protein
MLRDGLKSSTTSTNSYIPTSYFKYLLIFNWQSPSVTHSSLPIFYFAINFLASLSGKPYYLPRLGEKWPYATAPSP